MKTKYILHGGSAQHVNSDNDKFFAEILKGTKSKVKVLLVEFAGRDERKDLNIKIDSSQFERVKGGRELLFDIADEKNFLEQIKNADIVYIGGGTTVRLMQILRNYPNLKDCFSGKVIAGESAGANALSTYCYSKSGGGVIRGLGLVPVKMIPHYQGQGGEELEEISDKLETLLLPNYQFKVFVI